MEIVLKCISSGGTTHMFWVAGCKPVSMDMCHRPETTCGAWLTFVTYFALFISIGRFLTH